MDSLPLDCAAKICSYDISLLQVLPLVCKSFSALPAEMPLYVTHCGGRKRDGELWFHVHILRVSVFVTITRLPEDNCMAIFHMIFANVTAFRGSYEEMPGYHRLGIYYPNPMGRSAVGTAGLTPFTARRILDLCAAIEPADE